MSKLLEGKLALILGIANKWSLAYAIAQAFSREGASLALTYLGERQKDSIEELSKDLNVATILPCDVTKDDDLTALTESLRGLNRPLDAVVHSLAFANREDLSRPFVETSRSGFALATDVSAYSLVAVARATAPLMTEGGSLSTLTYLGSTRVITNYNVMGVAKAALEASVRYLAAEMGERKIRVNAISAGPVKTASMRAIKGASSILETADRTPLRRNTDPAEVADAAVFLASGLGRGVTGNILFVDAGMQIMGF
ncbi:MAG TPA: enoyl-ACP reductase [Candidatus Sulfopaludibacter sp.]|jgi:enoyl-[acyl-carrier protein] reductase I|nr:enoyl-ACP reductase [Candidatus Sulfopaludibacter sp.]